MMRDKLWVTASPLSNCCLVLAHIISILITGIPFLLIVAWGIVGSSFISSEIDSDTFSFKDVLSPNSFRPWWDVSYGTMVLISVILAFILLYFFIALF